MGEFNVETNAATMKISVRSTVAKILSKMRPVSKIPQTQLALT